MAINLKEFLAKQLNDHSESPSGVVQKTYYEWTESHIQDAIDLALCYVYSLIPQRFSSVEEYLTTSEDCLLNLCEVCSNFVGLASIEINGNSCIDIEKSSTESNSLIDLLSIGCVTGDDASDETDEYSWQFVDGSNCLIKFDRPVPINTKVKYLCSSKPESLDEMNANLLCEYESLIADYALWWLFRTDSESRSNLERARLHFQGVQFFVETKLLLEFSLREDDYSFGRRKVDDT